jgi:chloramphenicol O-acetyltransferase
LFISFLWFFFKIKEFIGKSKAKQLEIELLRQLFELMEDEEKHGRRWLKMRAQFAVEWYTNLAIANARKYGKENVERKKYQYFNKALKEKLIPKFYLSMGI